MLVNLENVRELEDEGGGLVGFEAEAAGEEVEAGGLDDLVGLGENEGLEFEDFADFFLDFHVVVVGVVADAVHFLGDGGGFGDEAGGGEAVEDWVEEGFGFGFEEMGGDGEEGVHFFRGFRFSQ